MAETYSISEATEDEINSDIKEIRDLRFVKDIYKNSTNIVDDRIISSACPRGVLMWY